MSADRESGGLPVLANRLPGIQASRLTLVSRLIALAIRLNGLIRSGELKDQVEVARVGRVRRDRVTQFMNLPFLAPDIQDQLLFFPPMTGDRAPVLLRDLQPITVEPNWSCRRELWKALYTVTLTK